MILNKTIFAQIEDFYDQQNNQIAGVTPLMDAVISNDIDGVRFFSKSSAALINQKNIGGATALHLAARSGNFEIARILVENGANVNAPDLEGWTPLMRAAFFQNSNIVDLLLSNGANATLLNSIGESAIIQATTSDCTKCLDLLFSKFNFIKYMGIATLKEQLSESFIIARNHENKLSQNLIETYLDKIIKLSPLIMTNNVAPQNQHYLKNQDNQFEVIPEPTKTIYAPARKEPTSNFYNYNQTHPKTKSNEPLTTLISHDINNFTPIPTKQANQKPKIVKFVFKGQAKQPSTYTKSPKPNETANTNYQKQQIIPTSHYSQNDPSNNSSKTPIKIIKKFKLKSGPQATSVSTQI